jgi:hypothetical protein
MLVYQAAVNPASREFPKLSIFDLHFFVPNKFLS